MRHEIAEEHLRTFDPTAKLGNASQWQGEVPLSLLEAGNNPMLYFLCTPRAHSVGTVHNAFLLAFHAPPIVKVEAHFVEMSGRQ